MAPKRRPWRTARSSRWPAKSTFSAAYITRLIASEPKAKNGSLYLAQAQNNWDDRLVALPKIQTVQDLKGQKIICHGKAPCVAGNLRAVLEICGLKPEEIHVEAIEDSSGKFLQFVDRLTSGEAVAALVDMPFDLYGIKRD